MGQMGGKSQSRKVCPQVVYDGTRVLCHLKLVAIRKWVIFNCIYKWAGSLQGRGPRYDRYILGEVSESRQKLEMWLRWRAMRIPEYDESKFWCLLK